MIQGAVIDVFATVSAASVTAAAGYVSTKAKNIADQVEKANERAEENRELIAGDPEAGPSLMDRVERVERELEEGS
jgi:hypothetical protein